MSRTEAIAPDLLVQASRLDEQHPLRFLWEHAPVGMTVTALDGRLLQVNRAFCKLLGHSRSELLSRGWPELTHPDDVARHREADRKLLSGEAPHITLDKRYLRADGTLVHCQLKVAPIHDADGVPVGLLGIANDVTEHVLAQQRLARAAHYDPLTGLPNRTGFLAAVREALDRGADDVAVLLVDLDRFRAVNDSIGHTKGDQFLVLAAERVQDATRPGEVVARYGGDEFIALIPGADALDRARALATSIHETLRAPMQAGSLQVYCTASIGIAGLDAAEGSAEAVIRDADIALYRAKEGGRGRTVEFDASMRAQVREAMALRADLHGAVARGEFRLHYQPIVDLHDGRAVGFEALLRWQHPERGLLAPDRFLSLAEEVGETPGIGRWALQSACAAMARITRSDDGPYVSVNLSMQQLADRQLIEAVDRALLQSRMPANRLRVEVTEAVVREDLELVVPTLDAMRARGIGIYVDDFGTGVSSYARLHRLPIDALKVDKGFVSGMDVDEDGRSLVYSIITLARSLGLGAIAEGVETDGQRRALIDLGCRHAQGYLFSRPMPLERARRYPMR
ncbi:MAG: EAL domain-containing protein [Alphaproteobacteria bacterium]|nr:EAL domain-containing protein [Alphaproteobacteria bacterium]